MTHTDVLKMAAKSATGLEEVTAEELRLLGAKDIHVGIRAVEFTGDKKLLYKSNFFCRTASHIMIAVGRFSANDANALYKGIYNIDWSKYLTPKMTLAITSHINESPFTSPVFVAQKTKDSIVDQIRKKTGRRPSVDTKNPDLRIDIRISGRRVNVSLDSSGEPLNRRGYRTDRGRAPLTETLAAGILILTGWDKQSPLIDPMCGSGTFVIEAALMARDIAPGLIRKEYGFMRWPDYDKKLFEKIKNYAKKGITDTLPFDIIGADSVGRTISIAQNNAKRAGVLKDITFRQGPFEQQRPPSPPGIVIMNPPYGERLKVENIDKLYRSIGDLLKQNFQGYRAYILTGGTQSSKKIGLRTSKKIRLFNGPIECRLLRYDLYSGTRKNIIKL